MYDGGRSPSTSGTSFVHLAHVGSLITQYNSVTLQLALGFSTTGVVVSDTGSPSTTTTLTSSGHDLVNLPTTYAVASTTNLTVGSYFMVQDPASPISAGGNYYKVTAVNGNQVTGAPTFVYKAGYQAGRTFATNSIVRTLASTILYLQSPLPSANSGNLTLYLEGTVLDGSGFGGTVVAIETQPYAFNTNATNLTELYNLFNGVSFGIQ